MKAAALVAAAAGLVLVQSAGARDATRAEVRSLSAAAARGDERALADLRAITSVDGRPIDLERALRGARGAALERRVRTLARLAPARAADPLSARRAAAEILRERRFREGSPPRPFRGPLAWLSERVRAIGEAIGQLLRPVTDALPGGERTLWGVVALGVLAAGALAAGRLVDRRAAAAAGSTRRRERRVDPDALEREADRAERRGELERALRLRFHAGLLRLQDASIVRRGDSVTTGEIARALASRDFELVAAAFDEIVYGRRPATRDDVDRARAGWARALARVGT